MFSLVFVHFMYAGYVANFQVDLRNGTSIGSMMRGVLQEFNVAGIEVYVDNLFVSVSQLRWCAANGINLTDTTRRTYGFPAELQCHGLQVSHCAYPCVYLCLFCLLLTLFICMFALH